MPGQKPLSLFWINLLNTLPNVFWSVLCLAPMYLFWYRAGAGPWLYGFGALSLIPYLIPVSLFRYIQLSDQPTAYKRLHVPWINHFTQHGTLVHRLAPGHRTPRLSVIALEKATYVREQFHLAVFLFFLLSALYAVTHQQPRWTLLLVLLNVIYNLYPMWLQQYIRLRLYSLRIRLEDHP